MFTGIIEEVGTIKSINVIAKQARQLTITANKVLENTNLGDSIAVNGICLTVTNLGASFFSADVMPETMRSTNLDSLKVGSKVNLERAMLANGRFGGHIVSGHIDGTAKISNIRQEANAIIYNIDINANMLKYIIKKGSITIDGISLTVVDVVENSFSVSLIPHTRSLTTMATKKVGDLVNIECDILARYVERLMIMGNSCKYDNDDTSNNSKISLDYLAKNGML